MRYNRIIVTDKNTVSKFISKSLVLNLNINKKLTRIFHWIELFTAHFKFQTKQSTYFHFNTQLI